jgi:curli production assembly/transport component CsgG
VNFSDLNGYKSAVGDYAADALTRELVNASDGRFGVVERRRLNQVLEEQNLGETGILDESTVAEIERILGVDAIVTGTVTYFPTTNEIEVGASVIHTRTALVFASAAKLVEADSRTSDLIGQRGASATGRRPRQSSDETGVRAVQRHDVYFENSFLRIDVETAAVSEDASKCTLALTFRNTSLEPIDFALEIGSVIATTEAGDVLVAPEDRSQTNSYPSWGYRDYDSSFERLEAGSSTTLVFNLSLSLSSSESADSFFSVGETDPKIEGQSVSFSAALVVPAEKMQEYAGWMATRKFRIGIANIEL